EPYFGILVNPSTYANYLLMSHCEMDYLNTNMRMFGSTYSYYQAQHFKSKRIHYVWEYADVKQVWLGMGQEREENRLQLHPVKQEGLLGCYSVGFEQHLEVIPGIISTWSAALYEIEKIITYKPLSRIVADYLKNDNAPIFMGRILK